MIRVDHAVVSGTFSLDGETFDVENNVWLVGDDDEVLVIDAPHDAAPIVEAVGGRRVTAIVLTHGHNDHINAAAALQDAVDAPILLHPAERRARRPLERGIDLRHLARERLHPLPDQAARIGGPDFQRR